MNLSATIWEANGPIILINPNGLFTNELCIYLEIFGVWQSDNKFY